MKPIIIVVSALVAGFLGGMLGARVSNASPKEVIRARSFEVVNEAGQAISYWGVDDVQDLVLTFGSRGPSRGGALHGRPPGDIKDTNNQLATVGLQGNDMPMLKMSGSDGKERVTLLVTYDGKPGLSMWDETGPRVSLGIEQSDHPGPDDNNWSLLFAPERARIGMGTEKVGGRMYVVGSFFVSKDKVQYPYEQAK